MILVRNFKPHALFKWYPTIQAYLCNICGVFVTLEEKEAHLYLDHYINTTLYKSDRIEWASMEDSIVSTWEHEVITGKCCCPYCGYAFNKEIFTAHLTTHKK